MRETSPLARTLLLAALLCGCSAPGADADADGDADSDADGDADECVTAEGACAAEIVLPGCDEPSAAPTDAGEVEAFVEGSAVPLRCTEGGVERWDLRALAQDFAGGALMMFGEVHYTNELGPLSAELFRFLVREGVLHRVALELGMEATDAANEYIETGAGPMLSFYGLDATPEVVFVRALLDAARELNLEGHPVTAYAVDLPMRPRWAQEQLEELGAGAGSGAPTILDTLPDVPEGLMPSISDALSDEALAYLRHLQDQQALACAELDEAECERLIMLARALWTGLYAGTDGFWAVEDWELIEVWDVEREQLIAYNYRTAAPSAADPIYAHMGLGHACRSPGCGGTSSMLDDGYEPTRGLVYTIAPGYGDGSRVLVFDGTAEAVAPEPPAVAAALQGEAVGAWYLSTRRPSLDCVGNPVSAMPVGDADPGLAYGEDYDALVFVRQLTPEGSAKSGLAGSGAATPLETWLEAVRRAGRIEGRRCAERCHGRARAGC